MQKRGKGLVLALMFLPCMALAGPEPGTNEIAHLRHALSAIGMSPVDMGFTKDLGKPRIALPCTRNVLSSPLKLPAMADDLYRAILEGPDNLWPLFHSWMKTKIPEAEQPLDAAPGFPVLNEPLQIFYAAAQESSLLLETAFGKLSRAEQEYLACSILAGTFNAEDYKTARDALSAAGFSSNLVAEVIKEGMQLDPKPSADRFLDALEKIEMGALLEAGRIFVEAAAQLRDAAQAAAYWPESVVIAETRLGKIAVGSKSDDVYDTPFLLILDPAGNDKYTEALAQGLKNHPLSAVVDLRGYDTYAGQGVIGPGAALWGVCIILDAGGNDSYSADYTGLGAGLFGAAWLEDCAGDDLYRAHALAEGAAFAGIGVLHDLAGNDLYQAGFSSQASAGVMAIGLLIDREGNDHYIAGGREHDWERNDERYISLSQGCAIGMRPYAGGGIAALVDLAGNDFYEADVYGQGVGYWYSIGMLLDASGHDRYSLHQYGQGAGIHLSAGLLWDGQGSDVYSGYILAQGAAHDYAVGMLFDESGNDTYTADHHSQGRALNTAMALLIDSAGSDGYFARQPDQCQGVGNPGDKREYGSLALLLDLQGADLYSCGAEDGARLERPDFGIVYDLKEEP